MKRISALILVLSIFFSCVSCADKETESTTVYSEENMSEEINSEVIETESLPDESEFSDGTYEIAFIADPEQIENNFLEHYAWDTIKEYAVEKKHSYKYYEVKSEKEISDEIRFNTITDSVEAGAKLIVCSGQIYENAIKNAAAVFPEVKFIYINGSVVENDYGYAMRNVCTLSIREEEAGFLAGYSSVIEGFECLGFVSGGEHESPSYKKFGYGFVQGADAAAKTLDKVIDVNYGKFFGKKTVNSEDLLKTFDGWFKKGIEVIFSVGKKMCSNVLEAAENNDGSVICIDDNDFNNSEYLINTVTIDFEKELDDIFEKIYNDTFSEIGGSFISLGIKEGVIGLSGDIWNFENFSVEEYSNLYSDIKEDKIHIDSNYQKADMRKMQNVKFIAAE